MTLKMGDEESNPEDDFVPELFPQSPRRRRGVGETDSPSPSPSNPSKSSLKTRDRPQGWSVYAIYTRLFRYFHRAWKEVRFREDLETEDVELNVVRYKPEGIEELTRTTKFNKKELQRMYRGFKNECPNGIVSEDTFKGIYSKFFPQGDATAYAHYVFNTFDTERNGSISFEEFVMILSELSRGTTSEKLRWAFSLYDINGDGFITKEELLDIVTAIYSLMGSTATPSVEQNITQQHVDRIFEKLDINKDGVVTMEEFMEICMHDETIANSMTILDTSF